ncbi:MAG: polysaccharide export protein, partial [Chloroflexi bacterium]|nr:polysaccharide export protein [Chloroflexota bacterium]
MFSRFQRVAPVLVLSGLLNAAVFGAPVHGTPAYGTPASRAPLQVAQLPSESPGPSVLNAPGAQGRLSAAGPVASGASLPQGGGLAPALPHGEVYRLAPNDQVAITVRGFQDLTTVVAVRPDGKIALPLLGNLDVAGKSVDQLRQVLVNRLTAYILQPDVTVTIVSYHQDRVYVLGDVRDYGTFPYAEGMSAQDALNLAGGADERGDLERVSVERNHQVVATLDLSDAHGVPFVLRPGDALMVPRRPLETVTVVGDVQKPGAQPLIRGEKILDAITAAGIPPVVTATRLTSAAAEPLPTPPDFAHVTLTRGGGAQA